MPKKKKHTKKRIWIYVLSSIILLLIVFRLFLPTIVLNYINKTLEGVEGYKGHVKDIDISLYRGAYQIKDIKLNKVNGKVPVPFFTAQVIDLAVQWSELFHGSVVAQITLEKPQINFVKGPTKAESQSKVDSSWIDVVDKWLPIKVNKLKINDGEVHYRDFHSSPHIDIFLKQLEAEALNLSNARKTGEILPSTVEAKGNAYGDGLFSLKMKMDALAKVPTFDLNSELKNVNLVKLNDFLKTYANIDVKKGEFGLYTEIAAKNGNYKGYVKPTLENLDILQLNKEEGSIFQIAWEALVAASAQLLKNKKEDRVASKAPFQGSFEKTDVDIWATIGSLLKNAFIQALVPSIDETINIQNVNQQAAPKSKKEMRKERREQRKEEREARKKN